MYHIKTNCGMRPYSIDKTLDNFRPTRFACHEEDVMELMAYYRGEVVTKPLVEGLRNHLCTGSVPPLPIVTSKHVSFLCLDGVYKTKYVAATLARHFELFADLYELDKDVVEITIPFPVEDVMNAVGWHSRITVSPPFACLAFLRPKRSEVYLHYDWSNVKEVDEKRLREIGAGLEVETKMHLRRFMTALPDWDLSPIVDWAVRRGFYHLLPVLLETQAPSALLFVLMCCSENEFVLQMIDRLIRGTSFEDKVSVNRPSGFSWYLSYNLMNKRRKARLATNVSDNPRTVSSLSHIAEAYATIDDPVAYKRFLSSLGVPLEDVEVTAPFGVAPRLPSKKAARLALEKLIELDPTFTHADLTTIVAKCRDDVMR